MHFVLKIEGLEIGHSGLLKLMEFAKMHKFAKQSLKV